MTTKNATGAFPDARMSWIIALAVLLLTVVTAVGIGYARFSVDEDHIAANMQAIKDLQQMTNQLHDMDIEIRDDVKWIRRSIQQKGR